MPGGPTCVDEVARKTGLDFMSELPDAVVGQVLGGDGGEDVAEDDSI